MRKIFIILIVLLSFGLISGSAQRDDSPLLRMLARIPDTAAARTSLTYADYRALIAARPGAPSISTWQEFDSISRSDLGKRMVAALMGLQGGPGFFGQTLMRAGDMAEAVGFDLFTIQRAAEYGQPPASVDILEGDFDTDAVIAAHTARGYTESLMGDLTLLCGADGCENGMAVNLRDRNPANPFGGALGRSQPVLVGDQLVASSASIDALDLTASAVNGDDASLADDADYRAAAEAVGANGAVLQAYFISPTDIAPLSEALTQAMLDAAEVKALRERLAKNFMPLPQYNLIAFADSATNTEQMGLVALVYAEQADAEAAAALFPSQLTGFQSLAIQRTFGDLLTERGVTSVEASVYPASTGRSVMLLTLHAPLPDGDTPSSVVFRLLVNAYFTRDLGWLATQF